MRAGAARSGDHIAIVAIGESAVAKDQGNILSLQSFLAFADPRSAGRFVAFSAKNFVERAAIL
jgi:hypothetical protein